MGPSWYVVKTFVQCMELEGLLLCLQEPTIGL